MNKRVKKVLVIGIPLIALLLVIIALCPNALTFFALQADSIQHAGTWEDDTQNWHRAFHEEQPAQVNVIHSKYWKSNHFTDEFIYYFEVETTPEWKDAFLKKRGFTQISPSVARTFRDNIHADGVPAWFAPDPIDIYDTWDEAGGFGSVWINKTNNHIFFYGMQL